MPITHAPYLPYQYHPLFRVRVVSLPLKGHRDSISFSLFLCPLFLSLEFSDLRGEMMQQPGPGMAPPTMGQQPPQQYQQPPPQQQQPYVMMPPQAQAPQAMWAPSAQPPPQQQPASADEVRTLWIGDLQYWMDENYLYTCFAHTGEV